MGVGALDALLLTHLHFETAMCAFVAPTVTVSSPQYRYTVVILVIMTAIAGQVAFKDDAVVPVA